MLGYCRAVLCLGAIGAAALPTPLGIVFAHELFLCGANYPAIISPPMPVSSGTKLGPYEIIAPAGAGGMGEVYRAPDTRLDRTVAIKVLPSVLCGDQHLVMAGGEEPRWRRDGKELFFIAGDKKLMAAEVKENASSFEIGTVRSLFPIHGRRIGSSKIYDVAADGQRFLVNTLEEETAAPLTLVTNWTAELKK